MLLKQEHDVSSSQGKQHPSCRDRIEHAQHLSGADAFAAFSQQQAVAVANFMHLLSDMHIMTDSVGAERSGAEPNTCLGQTASQRMVHSLY